MFAPSPRPSKRRRVVGENDIPAAFPSSPQQSPRAAVGTGSSFKKGSRSLITYGSRSSRKQNSSAVGDQSLIFNHKKDTLRPESVEAAVLADYDSTSASEGLSDDNKAEETPSKRKSAKADEGQKGGVLVDGASAVGLSYPRTSLKRPSREYRPRCPSQQLEKPPSIKAVQHGEPERQNHGVASKRRSDKRSMSEDELQISTATPADAEKKSPDEAPEGTITVRSSGRLRRAPRRHSVEMEIDVIKKTKETPTRKRGRPRKDDATPTKPAMHKKALHFEDIPREIIVKEQVTDTRKPTDNPPPVLSILDLNLRTPSQKRARPPILAKTPTNDKTLQSSQDESSTNSLSEEMLELLEHQGIRDKFSELKTHILEGLTGRRRLLLIGLAEEYQKVYQLVEQTVLAGEGNSMLIIGARGCAKTTLIETVVSELAAGHREDFHVVRLNGFIHTDDKIALKEIWRQLGREMEVDDESMGSRGNYADTLTSLLALLSHPAEQSTTEQDADHTTKSVIFIMDEFDLFATHSRQTLLYNLFDIAQSRKAPIAVVGLTTKIDVVESLEKRVKSRFSHRCTYLPMPKSFPAFREICMSALMCRSSNIATINNLSFISRLEQNDAKTQKLLVVWSKYITSLFETPPLSQLLRRIYIHEKSVPTFLSACLLPILSMSFTKLPTVTGFASNSLLPPDSKLHILSGLSELELSILISAARLDIILDTDTCNFNMAYDEYTTLASRMKIQSSATGVLAMGGGSRVWGREVTLGAWERLQALELLVPALGAGGMTGIADVGRSGKLWKVDVGLEEIGASDLEMNSVMLRWCKQI